MGLKKKFGGVKKNIVQKFDLAPEAVGCMRLTVIDNTDVYIENHEGVIEYTQKRISINIGSYSLVIAGSGLELEHFGHENIAVKGKILSIQYENFH